MRQQCRLSLCRESLHPLRMQNPLQRSQLRYITPSSRSKNSRAIRHSRITILLLMGEQIQLGSSPIELALHIIVIVCARDNSRSILLIHGVLVVIDSRMCQRPFPSTESSRCSLCYKTRIDMFVWRIDTSCQCHGSCEIECCSSSLEHDITRFAAFVGANEGFKLRVSEFVVYAAIGVLHGEHPADIIHSLRQHIRYREGGFGDIEREGVVVGRLLLVCHEENAHRIAAIDDILIIVASIVPPARRSNDRISRTLISSRRRMH